MQEVNEAARRLVMALRQVANDMVDQVIARLEDTGVEAKGFLGEAVDQYADRINGYATELAGALSAHIHPNLLAARELAAQVLDRLAAVPRLNTPQVRISPLVIMPARQAAQAIRDGFYDEIDIVGNMLNAIAKGREIEREAASRCAAVAVPDRLTITVDGPQGSGKTTVAAWLRDCLPVAVTPDHGVSQPTIIEMREGGRFDVRNEVFLDAPREG